MGCGRLLPTEFAKALLDVQNLDINDFGRSEYSGKISPELLCASCVSSSSRENSVEV